MIEPLESRTLFAASTLRIDCGGGGFVEASGKTFAADRGFTGGTIAITGIDVAGTDSDELFNTRRYGDFAYSLPIRNGDYRVRLYFMDPTHSIAGQRLFDVHAEKRLKLNDFDIAAAAGASNTAITKSITTTVNDGRLNLWFTGVKDDAIVSAIEVTPLPAAGITWKQLPSAPLPKFESMGDVVDGKLYVFGGYKNASVEATAQLAVFDTASGTWSTRRDMPEKLTHSGTAVDNAFIYFAGGYIGDWDGSVTPVTRHAWRYDTVKDEWQSMLSLPASRSAGQLIRVGRKLHFFGGVDPKKRDMGDHWVLDLRHPTQWVSAAAMPNPRNHFGAIETGAKIYAIGGQHNLNENTGNDDEVDAYDVITGTWSQVASLPLVLSHTHNATFASGGKVITVGGSTAGLVSVSDVLQYDPLANTWKKLGDLPTALSAVVADLVNGHIIVTGGTVEGIPPTVSTWINV